MGVKLLTTLAAAATLATPAGYVQAQQREDGGFGDPQITAWATLGLAAAGEDTGRAAEYLGRHRPATATDRALVAMARSAAGVRGRPIQRAVAFLRRHQNADGGFELTLGRGSDTQSTAWAIQALLAAGATPGPQAFRYLARMRRPDGSYRYNARYVTTPLWVTAQVLPAIARKPFPLRKS